MTDTTAASDAQGPSFKLRMDARLARWYRGSAPHPVPERQKRRQFLGSLVNKTQMRVYIGGLGLRLPSCYAEAAHPDELDFASLPDRVVIKPTNGADSKGVLLFAGERELLSGATVPRAERVGHVVSVCARERLFDKPGTRLLAEEFVQDYDPAFGIPRDFKVFVSGGQVRLIQVIDRNPAKPLRTNSFFDRDWTFVTERIKQNYRMGPPYARPPQLAALLADAERIARDIGVFYRLDFYMTATGPVFGEFTSYPSAGKGFTPFGDRLMCELMALSSDPDLG